MTKSSTCSCIICQKQFFVKSFHTHFQRIHLNLQQNYKNQTKNAILALIEKAKHRNLNKRLEYSKNPKICKFCNKEHTYEKRNNKFCSASCGASFSNKQKDYTKIKVGPSKGYVNPSYVPKTKISQCQICSRYHKGTSKTCSLECKKKLISIKINERIDAGWNPQENRCRSKQSYLEKSFESWLKENNYTNYIKNKTFRCDKKIYYGDFYFPKENILIELDGKQHLKAIEYDNLRDVNILKYYKTKTIRISYDEYFKKTKLNLIVEILNIKEQMTGLEPAEPIRL